MNIFLFSYLQNGDRFYENYDHLINTSTLEPRLEPLIYTQQCYDATWILAHALNTTLTGKLMGTHDSPYEQGAVSLIQGMSLFQRGVPLYTEGVLTSGDWNRGVSTLYSHISGSSSIVFYFCNDNFTQH